jgi:hypothetical protein
MIKGGNISNIFNSIWKFIKHYRTGIITVLILCFFYWLGMLPRPEPSANGYEESRVGRIDSIYVHRDTISNK